MSRKLERLVQIDSLLRSRKPQTQRSLAGELEVSDRTIRNDLDFLRDRFGAPLEYKRKLGWHYTDPTWRLPSIPLSKGELFALTLGAKMLECYAGSPYAAELQSAIHQLQGRLPETTRVNLQQVASERFLFRPGAITKLDPEIWHQLEDACQSSRQVWMRYFTASRKAETKRVIDPYLIYLYRGTNFYVVGFCHTRQEQRQFRIDRIRAIEVLDTTFTRDPSFDAKQYLENVFQNETDGTPRQVEIWFDASTAPYIEERCWHATQEIEKYDDGSLTLRMVVSGMNEVKRWVLGYGKGAIIQKPPELVQLVQAEIEAMACSYRSVSKAIPG
jgi:predicted DNA-binding transcriptional regulator YafY